MSRKSGGALCEDEDTSWNSATDEENVVNGVVQRRALLRDGCEYLLYKLTHIEQDLPMRWKLILIIMDAPMNAHLELECTNEVPGNSLIHFLDVLLTPLSEKVDGGRRQTCTG